MALPWVTQLLDAGLVTDAQVRASLVGDAAEDSVGTVRNLISNGLDERTLAGFFVSLGYGPILQARELAKTDRDLAGKLPGVTAHDLCALPLRPSPAGPVVAMADPTNEEAVRKLSDALGGMILPTVARFSDLLVALDEIYPGNRPTVVSDPLAAARTRNPSAVVPLVQEKERPQTATSSVEPRLASLASTASAVWDRAWDQSTGLEGAAPAAADPSGLSSVPPEPDLSDVAHAATRDELVRVACEACLPMASGAAFLALRKGVFRGWDGVGDHITKSSIRSLWVPATNPSVLNDVAHHGKVFHGPHGQTAADQLLRAALGSQGRDVLVAPVWIGKRMCGLLCATDPATNSAPIEAVAAAMGEAFQRLIVSNKS